MKTRSGQPSTRFPFAVERSPATTLVEQVVRGVRSAVLCGDWAFGQRVPSLRAATRALGVSFKTACTAYDTLCREGWLRRTPRKGYTAAAPDVPQWRGEMLLVAYGSYSDLQNVMSISNSLARAGWLSSNLFIRCTGDSEEGDYAILDGLLTRRLDLVMVFSPNEDVISRIRYAEKPYVVMTCNRPSFGSLCRGVIHVHTEAFQRGLLADCRRFRVRTAWCVNFQPVHGSVRAALRAAGIRVKTVLTGYDPRKAEHNDDIRDRAFRWFTDFLRREGMKTFPDLIVFLDDYVAVGALSALFVHGVRLPDDVQVVTYANHDNGQSYLRTFARLESDFTAAGTRVAEFLISCATRVARQNVLELETFSYVPGETFSRVVDG